MGDVIYFTDGVVKKNPSIYKYVLNKSIIRFVTYMINSKYRKTVTLRSWLNEQVVFAEDKFDDILGEIPSYSDYDKQIHAVFRWVRKNITYAQDSITWNMLEHWQTATETEKNRKGDCEDHAILLYVISRLKGIPAERMTILTGDVINPLTTPKTTVGHCWIAYRPSNYPLNWVFLDTTYYYKYNSVRVRNKFYIHGKQIYEYNRKDDYNYLEIDSNYLKIWFAFNELASYTHLRNKND